MPISPTYPGVYVQEVPSGVRTIVGVSTSTALFIGASADGPMNQPVLCLNYSDFSKVFSENTDSTDLARYIKLFFLNGGSMCYVMRIADGAVKSAVTLKSEAGASVLKLEARNEGVGGNSIRAAVNYDTDQPEATFNLELFKWVTDSTGRRTKVGTELWRNLSMNPLSMNYVSKVLNETSTLVTGTVVAGTDTAAKPGFSQAGRPFNFADAGFSAIWDSA
jgi:uncharacterized protein